LNDDYFLGDDDSKIVDECTGFFLGAANGTVFTVYNVIIYLMTNPECLKKVKDEIFKMIKQTFPKENVDEIRKNPQNWAKIVEYENINGLEYMQMIVNETLRLNPPTSSTQPHKLTETTQIGKYTIRSDTPFLINFGALHMDPE
jgi:cytochrome P450